jgi:hypothetical protein
VRFSSKAIGEEGIMWEFRHKVCALVSSILASRRYERRRLSHGRSTDWLPPVLGPEDWSIGMMSDRSASWYLDRGRA